MSTAGPRSDQILRAISRADRRPPRVSLVSPRRLPLLFELLVLLGLRARSARPSRR